MVLYFLANSAVSAGEGSHGLTDLQTWNIIKRCSTDAGCRGIKMKENKLYTMWGDYLITFPFCET